MLVKNDVKSMEKINKETCVLSDNRKKTRKRRLGVFFLFLLFGMHFPTLRH